MSGFRVSPRLFYAVVLAVALVGSGQAATDWLDWWAPFAFAAVAGVELGGVVLSVHADERRQLGERATFARLLSAGVAVGAVAVNWFGHQDNLMQAGFFAGMSALGYLVWLVDTAARRRDALRLAGMLPPTPPVYGLVRWLRHPWLTRRARHLALADPTLGLYGSLAAAEAAVRAERRQRALSHVLHAKIRQAAGPAAADIAVGVYDLDEVAGRLAADADYDGLTAIIAAEVTPTAVTATPSETATTAVTPVDDVEPVLLVDVMPAPTPPEDVPTVGQRPTLDRLVYTTTGIEPVQDGIGDLLEQDRRFLANAVQALYGPAGPDTDGNGQADSPPKAKRPRKPRDTAPKKPGRPSTETQVVAAFTRNPNTDVKRLAKRLGVSERTVQRHRPRPVEPVATTPNGSVRQEATS